MMKWNGGSQGWIAAIALGGLWSASSAAALAAAAPDGFECTAGEVTGVRAADGQTAVGIVCSELARVSGRSGRYHVSLRSLGASIIIDVERLDAPERQMLTLAGVEETLTAAPRLAQAIVRKEPMVRTQRVDNLLVRETEQTPLKEGRVSWGLGVMALEASGQSVGSLGGFSASVSFETPDFEVPAQFRVAGGGREDWHGAHLVAFSVGARFLPSKKSFSPFVGGGLGWLSWKVNDAAQDGYWYQQATYSGAAPYVEVGCETLRLHRTRMLVYARADFPLQNLTRPGYSHSAYSGGTVQEHSFYSAPITLGVSVAF